MEWISVKDRLPPEQERVLVCFEDGVITIERGVYLHTYTDGYRAWMPLPAAPQEEA